MLKLTNRRTKWFTVPQDTSGDTRIEILFLKPGEVADIEAKSNQVIGKQSGEEFVTEIGFNMPQRAKAFVSKAVVAWEGVLGSDNQPLPCTANNKLAVLKEFDWFGPMIDGFRTELSDEIESEREELEKN